jgi:DNA-3-methyladenine glycosylase I
MSDADAPRCGWAGPDGSAMRDYHDREWGVPTHDDGELFELLVLEGAQAGLSWRTVLERRDGYRRALEGFDPEVVAGFGEVDEARLLGDAGIIRNRAKVRSAITNARAWLALVDEVGTFDRYLWSWVDGAPVANRWSDPARVPATSPATDALSKDLKRRGFSFVGPTIAYAYAQSAGLVMDHLTTCFRSAELG